jgi:hypothetical protein
VASAIRNVIDDLAGDVHAADEDPDSFVPRTLHLGHGLIVNHPLGR